MIDLRAQIPSGHTGRFIISSLSRDAGREPLCGRVYRLLLGSRENGSEPDG